MSEVPLYGIARHMVFLRVRVRSTGARGLLLQGYLAHKKPPPPSGFHKALGIGLL